MKNCLVKNELISIDEGRMQKTIQLGQEYMETHVPSRTSPLRLLTEQIKYLSPLLWIVQFAALLLVFSAVFQGGLNAENTRNIFFQTAPIIALLAVPEFLKDIHFNMSELERSCKNRIGTILLLRLAAVGGINLITLALLSGILAAACDSSFLQLLLSVVVSYNLTALLSLFLVSLLKLKTRIGALAVSFAACAAVITVSVKTSIVHYMNLAVLLLLFIVTFSLLAAQIAQILSNSRKGDDLAWN